MNEKERFAVTSEAGVRIYTHLGEAPIDDEYIFRESEGRPVVGVHYITIGDLARVLTRENVTPDALRLLCQSAIKIHAVYYRRETDSFQKTRAPDVENDNVDEVYITYVHIHTLLQEIFLAAYSEEDLAEMTADALSSKNPLRTLHQLERACIQHFASADVTCDQEAYKNASLTTVLPLLAHGILHQTVSANTKDGGAPELSDETHWTFIAMVFEAQVTYCTGRRRFESLRTKMIQMCIYFNYFKDDISDERARNAETELLKSLDDEAAQAKKEEDRRAKKRQKKKLARCKKTQSRLTDTVEPETASTSSTISPTPALSSLPSLPVSPRPRQLKLPCDDPTTSTYIIPLDEEDDDPFLSPNAAVFVPQHRCCPCVAQMEKALKAICGC